MYLHPYTFVVLKETCCIMFISLTRDHFKKTFLAFMFRESRAKMFQRKSSFRSSHRRCSIKKGVFRSFAKLTGKHLCQRLFFNKETVFQKKKKKKLRLFKSCFSSTTKCNWNVAETCLLSFRISNSNVGSNKFQWIERLINKSSVPTRSFSERRFAAFR